MQPIATYFITLLSDLFGTPVFEKMIAVIMKNIPALTIALCPVVLFAGSRLLLIPHPGHCFPGIPHILSIIPYINTG
jgi:hypothetical protein